MRKFGGGTKNDFTAWAPLRLGRANKIWGPGIDLRTPWKNFSLRPWLYLHQIFKRKYTGLLLLIDFELAAVLHSHFRLFWLRWLDYSEHEDVEAIFAQKQRRIKNKVITLLEKELEADETSSSSENEPHEDGKDDFFGSLFVDKRSRKRSATKIAASFLGETPTKNILAIFATHEKLKLLFVKCNTALPSSAAVKRFFSTGKYVLRPKRARLSDEHFNMLVFLKNNFNK